MYHAFGIKEGYEYRSTKYLEGRVEFHLVVKKSHLKCPDCGNAGVHRRGGRTRSIRSVPIGMKPVVLVVEVPQCFCPECKKAFEVSPPLPKPTFTSLLDLPDSRAS
jgi:transposase